MRIHPALAAIGCTSALIASAITALPSPARACGGFFCDNLDPVVQTAERILFRVNADDTVTTIVEIQYQGPPSQFAWVLPVAPGLTVEDITTAPAGLFDALEERTAPVFMLATSNDTTKLPPELTRQGRFDETFFVDLPDLGAREHLFRLQLARRGRHHDRFDCAALAAATEGFSGAEIEQSVTNALYAAFAAGREIETSDIASEAAATRSLSVVNPQAIATIRAWGAEHARPA